MTIKEFQPSRLVKELRSFLGLCSCFRRFINRFTDVTHPMTRLLRKNTSFYCTDKCDTSFQQLKSLLTSQPILWHFDPCSPKDNLFLTTENREQFGAAPNFKIAHWFCVQNKILYKKNHTATGSSLLLVVPESLRLFVLSAMRDNPTSGHLGSVWTLYRAKECFYRPRMRQTTGKYVTGCRSCQCHKHATQVPTGQLQPVPPACLCLLSKWALIS